MFRAPRRPLGTILLLCGLLGASPVVAGDAVVSASTLEGTPSTGVEQAEPDLRDALAQVVIERNVVTVQRDSLQQQRWLIIAYAVVASLIAGWLLHRSLRREQARVVAGRQAPPVPETRPVRRATNATITIRNGATQQAELTERITTRRLFQQRPTPPRPLVPVPAATAAPAPVVAKPPAAKTPSAPSPALERKTTSATPRPAASAPGTRAEPATDRMHTPTPVGGSASILMPVEFEEPAQATQADDNAQVRITNRMGRTLAYQGLALLEVMISLAILATVLASLSAGIYGLSSSRRAAQEDAAVGSVMRRGAERLMGAEWEWLGRDRIDDPQRGAWTWPRPQTDKPLTAGAHPPLREDAGNATNDVRTQLLAGSRSGLDDLRLYLEYYRPAALELCFTPVDRTAAATMWSDIREAHRLPLPMDLRQHTDAVVVRLLATWATNDGVARQRELVFARTR